MAGVAVGGLTCGWLWWLFWEYSFGPGSDHSYDYMFGMVVIGGAILGALFGLGVSLWILRSHSGSR